MLHICLSAYQCQHVKLALTVASFITTTCESHSLFIQHILCMKCNIYVNHDIQQCFSSDTPACLGTYLTHSQNTFFAVKKKASHSVFVSHLKNSCFYSLLQDHKSSTNWCEALNNSSANFRKRLGWKPTLNGSTREQINIKRQVCFLIRVLHLERNIHHSRDLKFYHCNKGYTNTLTVS